MLIQSCIGEQDALILSLPVPEAAKLRRKPVSPHPVQHGGRPNYLSHPPDTEITAFSSFTECSRSLKYHSRQIAIDSLVVFTENPGKLRTAQLREGSAVRAGSDIHAVFVFLLRIERVLKAVACTEHLLC